MQRQDWRFRLVTTKLQQGAVIAYPTEGVWGLGCIPACAEAVERILRLKNRSWKKGLILVGSDIEQILPYVDKLTDAEMKILKSSWPGPVTFLIRRSDLASELVRGTSDKVAIRVSDHSVVNGLCHQLGGPLISTSANPSGKKPAASRLRLQQYFPQGIDYIFPGELGESKGASEIRDLHSGEIIREAAV